MKLLLVLEAHLCKKDNEHYYANRVVNKDYLERYLQVFDEIYLCARTTEDDLGYKFDINHDKVKVVPLPEFKGAKGLLKNLFKIKKIINKMMKEVDAVIYRAPTHLSIFTYKLAIKNNIPFALEFMMAANKMIDGDGFIKNILNKMIDNTAKKMCLKADGVSYVTESILQKTYPCQAIINKNNLKYFTESYSSIDLEEDSYYYDENKTINDNINIIHIGYMDSLRKGQDVLINACKIVLDKGYNIKLTLVGDGIKKNYFEDLTKELNMKKNVIFYGAVTDNKEKNKLLRNSDLFVFPTQSEGLPRTIIEAMANSLCCIASSVDGIPELLDDEYLVDDITAENFAHKIIDVINDKEKMLNNGKSNYNKSLKYKKEKLQKKRKNFYKKLYNTKK